MSYALVFGRAKGVWDEIVDFRRKHARGDEVVIAVGRAGQDYPGRIDHWVSFHAELFDKWTTYRQARGFPNLTMYWTALASGRSRAAECAGYKINSVQCNGGSSGLIGIRVAQHLGLKVVLCGIPMEPEAAHYDENGQWNEALVHQKIWEKHAPELKPWVRSMSGWTQRVFGAPSAEWIAEG